MAPMCTPCIKSQKWLPWQRPLGARYRQYLHSVGRPLKAPSITNCLVAIVHTKPIAILVPKLVALAMTLRHSISVMFSSDSLTPKTYPSIKQRHATKVIAHRKPKKPVRANCVPKLVIMATSSVPLDSHITHPSP